MLIMEMRKRQTAPALSARLADVSGFTRSMEEGDDVAILFSSLLKTMAHKGFFEKMNEWKPNRADPNKFLSKYWFPFVRDLDPPWLKMDIIQKSDHLKSWLLNKWSVDPKKKCMCPRGGKRLRCNDMGWPRLEMTDAELDEVVREVMEMYAKSDL